MDLPASQTTDIQNIAIKTTDIQTIDALSLASLMQQEAIILVDVRESWEYAQGYLPDAVNIALSQLTIKAITALPDFAANKKIILYCAVGVRSARACLKLALEGINNSWNLNGGIISWKEHNLPIVKPI